MKVKATKIGYYELKRRYPGDVFELKKGHQPGSWMEPYGGKQKPKVEEVEQEVIEESHDSDEVI